jgi:hypothetical protein
MLSGVLRPSTPSLYRLLQETNKGFGPAASSFIRDGVFRSPPRPFFSGVNGEPPPGANDLPPPSSRERERDGVPRAPPQPPDLVAAEGGRCRRAPPPPYSNSDEVDWDMIVDTYGSNKEEG